MSEDVDATFQDKLAPYRERLNALEKKYNTSIRSWDSTNIPSHPGGVYEEDGVLHAEAFGECDIGGLRANNVGLCFIGDKLDRIRIGDRAQRYEVHFDTEGNLNKITFPDPESEMDVILTRSGDVSTSETVVLGPYQVQEKYPSGFHPEIVDSQESGNQKLFPEGRKSQYYFEFDKDGKLVGAAREGTNIVFLEPKKVLTVENTN